MDLNTLQEKLKNYRLPAIVKVGKITGFISAEDKYLLYLGEVDYSVTVSESWMNRHNPVKGGYLVFIYGMVSYLPEAAFEDLCIKTNEIDEVGRFIEQFDMSIPIIEPFSRNNRVFKNLDRIASVQDLLKITIHHDPNQPRAKDSSDLRVSHEPTITTTVTDTIWETKSVIDHLNKWHDLVCENKTNGSDLPIITHDNSGRPIAIL